MSIKASDFLLSILVKKPEWHKINLAQKKTADRSPGIIVSSHVIDTGCANIVWDDAELEK